MSDEIAYRELKPGEVIQAGDEWQVESGQWALFHQSMIGQTAGVRSRRPYNITQMTRERDTARAELAQLQQPPPPADHFADVSKMVETELERMAWELYSRELTFNEKEAFEQAEAFIAERDRRRQAGVVTTDVAGD